MVNYSAFHWSEKARKYAETIGTIFNVKGRVNTVADLPSTGNKVGDLYLVGLPTDADLIEYAWLSFDNVTRWEKLGSTAISTSFSSLTGSPYDNTALGNALGDKYDASNPDGYITGITSAMVTTALGYTPYNSSNPSGYITGITSAMVTTALGYTPQQQLVSGTNIKTINGNSLLGSGNLALDGLPSQAGNACKFLTTDGTDASWGIPKTHNLFDFIWRDAELNDQSWLRSDTFSWQSGLVYTAAYNHLVDDIDGKTATTETVGSYTISYYLADDGHKITTDETTVANIYSESGVAWYYILDTTNQRFKLPRTKYGFVGLRDTVEKYVPESLPNITGQFQGGRGKNLEVTGAEANGAFSYIGTASTQAGTGFPQSIVSFSAANSSSTYKNSAPVQQRATQMYLYFYVGQFSQTAIEQTAGLNSGLFNGKVDLNAANLSTAGKSLISGLGMPKQTSTLITLGASGTQYEAPANGYFNFRGRSSAAYQYAYIGDPNYNCAAFQRGTVGANDWIVYTLPIRKGDKCLIVYTTIENYLYFIEADGE